MVLHIKDVKNVCSKILSAVDSGVESIVNSTLELETHGNILSANITNNEYYVQYKLELDDVTEFHATVASDTFLKLMQMITTETVELTVEGTSLVIRGNGQYTLPLIFQGDSLLRLPTIDIQNVISELDIDNNILTSIYTYNDKEIKTPLISSPIQKLLYMDNFGAISHTKYGACINTFNLSEDIKVIFNQKFVKLFKLFDESPVHITLGKDEPDDSNVVQTKIKLETKSICITSILSSSDDNLNLYIAKAPKIRSFAIKDYPYTAVINRDAMIQSLNRMLVFNTSDLKSTIGTFKFETDSVTIKDESQKNFERLVFVSNANGLTSNDTYSNNLDLKALKGVLDTCIEPEFKISFGDHQAITITHGNITNILQERRS